MSQKMAPFTLLLILIVVAVSIIGMNFNVKTVAIAKEIQSLKQEINTAKAKNTRLKTELLRQTRLEIVDHIARTKLNMHPTTDMIYFTDETAPTSP